MVHTGEICLTTRGAGTVIDLTGEVAAQVTASGLQNGTVTVFSPGSTGGITTVEFENGLVRDLGEMFDRLAPRGPEYHHDARWGDGNGFSHCRASLLGPSLTVPVVGGEMVLGTWQQIVFCDFDNRARDRRLVVQVLGET
ncbi:MAG: secondary thiamine-phosphate synthase enzyme YjbQ [Acidobacteriota bacterium]